MYAGKPKPVFAQVPTKKRPSRSLEVTGIGPPGPGVRLGPFFGRWLGKL